MRFTPYIILFLLFYSGAFESLHAQQSELKPQLTRILIIFDFSNSMFGIWESDSKINVARKIVSKMVDSLGRNPNVELALRCYGHQKKYPPQDCDDTKLEVPFGKDNAWLIKSKITKLNPSGTTPIAQSLEACAADFPDKRARNIVLLITDGKEECGGDPCAISAALQSKGITLRPFIVGVGVLDADIKTSFNCIGNYYDAANESTFSQVINIIVTQVLNTTTSQVSLLDASGKPTETDVAMTFYDEKTGEVVYNYMHTLNQRGLPDTLRLDHLRTYKLLVHTLPPIEKKGITLDAGKHTIIPLDAPQGFLNLKAGDSPAATHKELMCIVRKQGDTKTLYVQTFTNTQKLLTGSYDLEILTLPRTYVQDVKITQSHTTTVKIDEPGTVNIQLGSTGIAQILQEDKGKLIWVYTLPETITNDLIKLQPGKYRAIYRAKNARETLFTVEKPFIVKPGISTQVILK